MTRKKNKHMCNKTKSMIEEEKMENMLELIVEGIENEDFGTRQIMNTNLYMHASERAKRYSHYIDKYEIQEMYYVVKAKIRELDRAGDFKWTDILQAPYFITYIHDDEEEDTDRLVKTCDFIGFFIREVLDLSAENKGIITVYDAIYMYRKSTSWLDFISLNMSDYLSENAHKRFLDNVEKYKSYYQNITSREYFQAFLNI